MKILSEVYKSQVRIFENASFLNESDAADKILTEAIGKPAIEWYPQNSADAWTDIVVLDGKYYAACGDDSASAYEAKVIYVEIEPTEDLINQYNSAKSADGWEEA